MCGRFALNAPASAVAEALSVLVPDDLLAGAGMSRAAPPDRLRAPRRHNIAPTDPVIAVSGGPDGREAGWYRWGLLPPPVAAREGTKGRPIINARADSLLSNGLFRRALETRRVVVPATGFYEWTPEGGRKVPWFLRPRDGSLLRLAGLAAVADLGGHRLYSCTIVTTEASADVTATHDRMPVVLDDAGANAWLDPRSASAADLVRWCVPAPPGTLEVIPASDRVNDVRNDDPGCVPP